MNTAKSLMVDRTYETQSSSVYSIHLYIGVAAERVQCCQPCRHKDLSLLHRKRQRYKRSLLFRWLLEINNNICVNSMSTTIQTKPAPASTEHQVITDCGRCVWEEAWSFLAARVPEHKWLTQSKHRYQVKIKAEGRTTYLALHLSIFRFQQITWCYCAV